MLRDEASGNLRLRFPCARAARHTRPVPTWLPTWIADWAAGAAQPGGAARLRQQGLSAIALATIVRASNGKCR